MSHRTPQGQDDKTVQSYFQKIYSVYQEKVEREDAGGVHARVQRAIEPRLAGVVVDIGSGGLAMYKNPAIRKVISLDNVLEFLRHAKGGRALNVAGDIRALPLKDGTADRIIIEFVIHHLTEKHLDGNLRNVGLAVAEASRILRPGGEVYFIDSMVPFLVEQVERAAYRLSFGLLKKLRKPMVFFFSAGNFCRILRRHGLAPNRVLTVDWGTMTDASAALFPWLKFPLKYAPARCRLISAVKC